MRDESVFDVVVYIVYFDDEFMYVGGMFNCLMVVGCKVVVVVLSYGEGGNLVECDDIG